MLTRAARLKQEQLKVNKSESSSPSRMGSSITGKKLAQNNNRENSYKTASRSLRQRNIISGFMQRETFLKLTYESLVSVPSSLYLKLQNSVSFEEILGKTVAEPRKRIQVMLKI